MKPISQECLSVWGTSLGKIIPIKRHCVSLICGIFLARLWKYFFFNFTLATPKASNTRSSRSSLLVFSGSLITLVHSFLEYSSCSAVCFSYSTMFWWSSVYILCCSLFSVLCVAFKPFVSSSDSFRIDSDRFALTLNWACWPSISALFCSYSLLIFLMIS